ncbi:hypothetical protein HDZ31DRAFT_81946 [Schizophyllum fasciatum]
MRGHFAPLLLCAAALVGAAPSLYPEPDAYGGAREEGSETQSAAGAPRRGEQKHFDFEHAGIESLDHTRYPHHPIPEDRTIYQIISDSSEFSKFAKAIDFVDEVAAYLNSSASDLTFFVAPDYEHDHLFRQHEFYGVVAAVERSVDDDPNVDAVRATIRSSLTYHTIAERLHIHDMHETASFPTRLAIVGGAEGAWQRLKIEQRKHHRVTVNGRSIIREPIHAANGVIYVLDLPLSTPGSMHQALLDSSASWMLSAMKHADMTELLDAEGSTTLFAPDDRAFEHLPETLRSYLFSDEGRPAMKKLLEYHFAPRVLFYSDGVEDTEEDLAEAPEDSFEADELYIIIQVDELEHGMAAQDDDGHRIEDTHSRFEGLPPRGGDRNPRDRRAPVSRRHGDAGKGSEDHDRPLHHGERRERPVPAIRGEKPRPNRGEEPYPPHNHPFRGEPPRDEHRDYPHLDEYPLPSRHAFHGEHPSPPEEGRWPFPPPPHRGAHPPAPPPDCGHLHPRPPFHGDHPPPPPPPLHGEYPGPHDDRGIDGQRPRPPFRGPPPRPCHPGDSELPPPPPPHGPPSFHKPPFEALVWTLDATLPTLAGALLHARVDHFALPHPPRGKQEHKKPPPATAQLTLNGVHVLASDIATANGPLHVLSRVLCPRGLVAEDLAQMDADPWANWEEWLVRWVEEGQS